MNYIERGLYRELLDECWAEGSIPAEISELAEICDCPKQVLADAWQKLSKCFTDAGTGRLVNLRLEAERTETDKIRATKALAGKAGGSSKSRNAFGKPAGAKQVLTDASGSHIEEESREVPPKPPKGGGRRRTRTEILAPFSDGTRRVVNTLGNGWHKADPRDGRKITISPEGFAEAVDRIKGEQPHLDDEMLIEAAQSYLAEPHERYKAPQWFFGPEGPWRGYVRAILTRRETAMAKTMPLQQVSA